MKDGWEFEDQIEMSERITETVRQIVWTLRSEPDAVSVELLASHFIEFRNLVLSPSMTKMMKRQHKIWSSSEGRIDLNESFKVGVQATVDTFILVRQSREGDLDWSKARMAAKDFLFAIGELRKFTIQCRSLADGITEKEASRRIEVQRDIRLAKVDPSGVQYGQESKEVDDSTQNLLEEWPTRRKDNWPRPLAEKVRELRLSGETWQDVKRHLRQIDLEQLPRKYQNNPIPKTWPSRQIQDRWIGMLNSIEQFERLQSNKAEHEMSKEVFGEKTE